MRLTPGTHLEPYEIVSLIGAGGMGEVYRARDTRLGREVALKTLPEGFAGDPDRMARFRREARVAAGLNHPGIVVLHSIEEHEGLPFLTMELVEGESLDTQLERDGLPLERILEIAIPLAEALVAAHERGVVHRDLKPANVIVTEEGRIKILDFGLAKWVRPADDVEPTQEVTRTLSVSADGAVLGTVPYMAPEQLRGESVDARTDIFALGVILHELAAGGRPFSGASPLEICSAILRDPAPPLRSIRPDLPADLERIVGRCLEKAPRSRYQTALDVKNELESLARTPRQEIAARPRGTNGVSIAVLPFVNRSPDPADEYFSDGLADELLNTLVKVQGLRVAARASSFHFKGKDATVAEVGRALHVGNILDGSVRKAGDRVRIAVQLVNVADGYPLWSETYDRTLDDIFAVQDDIARSVVTELRRTLLDDNPNGEPEEGARAEVAPRSRRRPYDPEAYDLYLRGRYLMGASDDGPVHAQEMFRRAIERSPSFALAYAGLGDVLVLQSWRSSRDREETVPKARAALARALELDDQLCEARVLAAQIQLFFDWDWEGAERDFRLAIELNPSSDLAHREYANLLSILGRDEEGLREARKAQELDPLSVNATHEVGYQHLVLGRLPEGAAEFRKAIDLNPTWIWGNIKLGLTYGLMGKSAEALACVRRADELLGEYAGLPLTQAWIATTELLAGDPRRARETLARLESDAESAYVDPVAWAWLRYYLGDRSGALDAFEVGYRLRTPTMAYALQGSRYLWREIADEARFRAILVRMGLSAAKPL